MMGGGSLLMFGPFIIFYVFINCSYFNRITIIYDQINYTFNSIKIDNIHISSNILIQQYTQNQYVDIKKKQGKKLSKYFKLLLKGLKSAYMFEWENAQPQDKIGEQN